jgi:hypothetical protein
MASVFNPNTVDFTKEEINDISAAIYERTYANPMLADYFVINSGVKKDQQIAILGRMQTKLGKGSGGCEPTASTNAIPMSQKVWSTTTISDRLAFCWTDDVKGTFFQWATKNGIAKEDLTSTTFAAFIVERMEDAMDEMHHRLFWFNDTDAALTSASPAGVITATEDVDFYNKIDGAWKQLFAAAAANADRVSAGLSSRNGQASYALQKFTAADRTALVVSNTLDEMIKDADERLVDGGSLKLVCTKSVWDQYRSELKFANVSFTTERLESGIEVLYADGLELHKYSIWDRIIREAFDDGTKYFLPHRILMYDTNTMQAATEEEGTLSEVDIFYDKVTKKTFFDFQFDLDVKVVEEDYLVQMAY